MYATSSGKSFLASLTDNDLNVRLLAKRTRFTPLTLVDEDDLRASIRRSRSRGYATAVAELQVDYCATSAAVQNSNSDVVAAVSIGGPRKRLTSKRLAELGTLVRAAAEGVSRVLRS